jgi:hypothetical protein
MESMGKIWGVEAVRGRRCADQAGMPLSRERLVLHLSKNHRSGFSLLSPKYSTISAHHILETGLPSRSETPAPIPKQIRSFVHRLQELNDEQQLRELLDDGLSDECEVRHLSGLMIDAIRSNKNFLVEELLRRNLPMSPIYVLEAVKAKAKDILTTFFTNYRDINKPMGGMDPPILM